MSPQIKLCAWKHKINLFCHENSWFVKGLSQSRSFNREDWKSVLCYTQYGVYCVETTPSGVSRLRARVFLCPWMRPWTTPAGEKSERGLITNQSSWTLSPRHVSNLPARGKTSVLRRSVYRYPTILLGLTLNVESAPRFSDLRKLCINLRKGKGNFSSEVPR